MAKLVAEETGGELFRIVPEVPYGEDFYAVANRANSLNRLTSLATVLTDDVPSISGNRMSSAERKIKSWAASVAQ